MCRGGLLLLLGPATAAGCRGSTVVAVGALEGGVCARTLTVARQARGAGGKILRPAGPGTPRRGTAASAVAMAAGGG